MLLVMMVEWMLVVFDDVELVMVLGVGYVLMLIELML